MLYMLPNDIAWFKILCRFPCLCVYGWFFYMLLLFKLFWGLTISKLSHLLNISNLYTFEETNESAGVLEEAFV